MEIFKKLKERLQNFFINVEGIKILLAEAKAFEEINMKMLVILMHVQLVKERRTKSIRKK